MSKLKCIDCGTVFDDSQQSCPTCGCPKEACEEIPEPSSQASAPLPTPEPIYDEDNGSNAKWWALAVIVILIVAVGIGFVLNKRSHNDSEAVMAMADTATVDTVVAEPIEEDTIVHITPEFTKAISKYEELGNFSERLAPVKRGGKWGFINVHGEEIIPCQYDYADIFSEGKAAVKKGNRWGYINVQGEIIIPFFNADEACSFSEGRAYVIKDGDGYCDTYIFIDEHGKKVFGGQAHWVYMSDYCELQTCFFKNGTVRVGDEPTVTYDKQGNVVSSSDTEHETQERGKYIVFRSGGRDNNDFAGLKDASGKIVIPAIYHGFHYDGWGDKMDAPYGVVLAFFDSDNEDDYNYFEGGYSSYGTKRYYGYVDLNGNSTFPKGLKERCDKAMRNVYAKMYKEMEVNALHGAWLLETSDGNIVMVFRDSGKIRTYVPGVPCLTSTYSLDDGVVTINNGKGHMYFRDNTLTGVDGAEWTKISSDIDYVP